MTTRSDWVETQTVGGSFLKNLSKPGTTHDVFQLELNTGCPYTGSLMVWFYRRAAAICSAIYYPGGRVGRCYFFPKKRRLVV